jgi:hypothetical protein
MTHDRKPGRVRVLKAGDESPQRRRHDSDPVVIDAMSGAKAGTGRILLLISLFLLATIGCAAATELYLPL